MKEGMPMKRLKNKILSMETEATAHICIYAARVNVGNERFSATKGGGGI